MLVATGALEQALRTAPFDQDQNACVVTRDTVPGLPAPAALVADRWGEIVYLTAVPKPARGAFSALLGALGYVVGRLGYDTHPPR